MLEPGTAAWVRYHFTWTWVPLHVLTSQVNISSLWLSVAARFIWTAVNPVASPPPPHPLPGSPLIAGCLWEEKARIVSWHLPVVFFFFWNACIAVDHLQRRKFVVFFFYCCGRDGEILQVGINPLTAAWAHACFAISSKPVMHSYSSNSTSPFNKWGWWEWLMQISISTLVVSQPMRAILMIQ